jgi:hypothetical protein
MTKLNKVQTALSVKVLEATAIGSKSTIISGLLAGKSVRDGESTLITYAKGLISDGMFWQFLKSPAGKSGAGKPEDTRPYCDHMGELQAFSLDVIYNDTRMQIAQLFYTAKDFALFTTPAAKVAPDDKERKKEVGTNIGPYVDMVLKAVRKIQDPTYNSNNPNENRPLPTIIEQQLAKWVKQLDDMEPDKYPAGNDIPALLKELKAPLARLKKEALTVAQANATAAESA